jgi:MFS transporter, DHA1 family, multidrug resistance protein
MASQANSGALRRVPTDHVDACHLPDDDERHDPRTEPPTGATTPTRPGTPSHGDPASRHFSEERTLADRGADAEKGGVRRRSKSEPKQCQLPPEERAWEDDIVTFDSKTDPENPKNVSIMLVVVLVSGKSHKLDITVALP